MTEMGGKEGTVGGLYDVIDRHRDGRVKTTNRFYRISGEVRRDSLTGINAACTDCAVRIRAQQLYRGARGGQTSEFDLYRGRSAYDEAQNGISLKNGICVRTRSSRYVMLIIVLV